MSSTPPRRKNHLIWIGVLISVTGLVSYFTFFARFPATRDIPWVNLTLVCAGMAVSALAIRRRMSFLSVTGFLLSAASAGLLTAYVYVLSNQLPVTEGVVAVGAEAPDFELTDDTGATVGLGDFRGNALVLVFYRGFW